MTLKRIEKVLSISLVSLCILAIILRILGILPPIIVSNDIGTSQMIFAGTGIQGLLAVFAIVISLTLMGIQFASQQYTHRVMNTFVRSYMLWTMIGSYLITVLYNLYMTAILHDPVNTLMADISVILQSLCLVLLVPHFVVSLFQMKPDYTINSVLNSVSKDYLHSIKSYLIADKINVPHKIDRLLPAVEILEKSIELGDRATVRMGIEEMLACYRRFVHQENEEWQAKYFLDYFLRLGREAVIEADDDSIAQILEAFGEIGNSTENSAVIYLIVNNIRTIGSAALKKEYDAAVEQMIDSLQSIAIKTPSPDITERILYSLGEIGAQLFTLDKKLLILYLTKRMSEMPVFLVEKKDFSGLKKWAIVLEDTGRIAVGREMRDVVRVVIQSLYQAGINVAKVQADVCDAIIETLVRMERKLPKTDRELYSEINFAKQEIEQNLKRYRADEAKESRIETSDLW
jgi:hypothetical protein